MDQTERVQISMPTDYTFIVPDGWFRLTLDPPEVRDAGITALADLQFRGIDNAPHLKEQLMRQLQRKAKEAYRIGGIELYLSLLTVGPIPLASSLLVSIPPLEANPGSATAQEVASTLSEGGTDVRVTELPAAGSAVREYRKEEPSPDEQMGNTLPTTTVIYHVPIPGSTAWLMMTFSTPLDPLADRMVELFDVVAQTLSWS
jgi:hypothetical protein